MSTKYLRSNENKCPVCGSHEIASISRITGYLSFDERFNAAKVCERTDRVKHFKLEVN